MEEIILYWNKLKFHMTYFTNNDRKRSKERKEGKERGRKEEKEMEIEVKD